ncbi:Ig-like domain-containing protein [Steroidobacter sp.]|uniref:Ig-like domain-containing protein n=1 Tax=Steroidobacter sp. TaxID=1978227 RepID=UPI001A3C98BF|nr:Ig-like domain-containing protein [Steroidobacter sp.]MBL8271742.1 Ig-like domain repeat protein [Steroidobacter sp.]
MDYARRALALVVCVCLVGSAHAAETLTYTYDALGRLSKVVTAGGPGSGVQRDYQYDAVGNREGFQSTGATSGSPVTISPVSNVANVAWYGVSVGVNIAGTGSAGGMVTFTENGVFLGSAFVYGNQASIFLEGLAAGVHTITASYTGDGSNAPTSYTFTIKVRDLRWLPAVLDLLLQ